MKKINFYTLFMLGLLMMSPSISFATKIDPTTTSSTNPNEIPAEVKVMLNRLDEIKEMDKSKLSSSEKKELRKEVRSIKKYMRSTGNGVYLSIGAIIIIVLLLILLL